MPYLQRSGKKISLYISFAFTRTFIRFLFLFKGEKKETETHKFWRKGKEIVMIYDVIWNEGQALFSLFNQNFYLISDAVYKSSIHYLYLVFEV